MANRKILKVKSNGIERLFPWIGALTVVIALPISDDPVNVWKFLVILSTSGILLGLLLLPTYKYYLSNKKARTIIFFFFGSMLCPLFFSGSPLLQQIYGVSGRLTGFLSLSALALIFFIASSGLQIITYQRILLGLVFAGTYNLILSAFENFGIEPIKFDNQYKVPLGSLGNPNFISAFLAIFIVISFSLLLHKDFQRRLRIFLLLQIPIALFELTKVGSKQGFYVVVVGAFLVLYLRFRANLPYAIRYLIQSLGALLTLLIAAGFLNKGPASHLVYKNTAQFRYEYWIAGLRMAKAHILTGVGLNSFGDWFRQYRSIQSITSPGKDVTTNASHNLLIDYLTTGGIFHLIAYLATLILVIASARKFISQRNTFDPIFTALFAGWTSYQFQSLISIDNLGLAIWGWILGGSVIGYTRVFSSNDFDGDLREQSKKKSQSQGRKVPLDQTGKGVVFGFIGLLVMSLAASPIVIASISWRNALLSRQVENVVSVGKKWPDDEVRLVKAVGLLINNQQNKIALDLATNQISKYPRSVSLRYYIIKNPLASNSLIAQMKRENHVMDPLNPDWN
jgi:hypothetical protein